MSSVHPDPPPQVVSDHNNNNNDNNDSSCSNDGRGVTMIIKESAAPRPSSPRKELLHDNDDDDVEATSVTAAEPLEDDHESIHDEGIPTIRLSSLGVSMEKDFQAVRDEFGYKLGDSSGTDDNDDIDNDDIEHQDHGGEHYDHFGSQEFIMNNSSSNSNSNSNKPNRQRLVSEEGVIAEFDLDAKPDETHDDVQIVANPIHIPGPGDESFRSAGCDLELGDEEPFPYPSSASSSPTARQSTTSTGQRMRTAAGVSLTQSNSATMTVIGGGGGNGHRAALISGTILKNSETDDIGICLKDDEPVIYSMDLDSEHSLLSSNDCPFRPGDRVLSINTKRTENMQPAEAARILQESTGFVTIVVHNIGGHPCLIETLITKQNKNQRSGMGLKSTGDRDLRVSSINENGLFAQSLLNVGDRILSINDVDVTEVDARVACDIIKNSEQYVRVVARTRHTTGVVVAEVSTRGSSTFNGTTGAAPIHTEGDEIEAVDDTCRVFIKRREQYMLLVCMVLLIVAIFVGIFVGGKDNNADDDDTDDRDY